MALLEHIIIRPLVTEKAIDASDDGSGRYAFRVILKANKYQVKQSVEKMYGVKVLKVRTIVNPGRVKRSKAGVYKTGKWKKALVQLQEGDKIELFKGV